MPRSLHATAALMLVAMLGAGCASGGARTGPGGPDGVAGDPVDVAPRAPTPVSAVEVEGELPAAAASPSAQDAPPEFRRHKIFPLPIVFYMPETRWAGGAGALWTYRSRPEVKPLSGSGTFVYTQNRQVEVNLSAEGYTADGDYHGAVKLAGREFPDVLYGVGNESLVDFKEEYTERELVAGVELKRRVAPGLYLGGAYGWSRQEVVELQGGGPLSAGVPGGEGGVVSQLSARLLLDTRDHLFQPTRGTLLTATARGAGGPLGGDHSFTAAALDARRYVTVRPGHVLAFQGLATAATEGVPFQEMGALGGQNLLRGYFGGRFRDRSRLALQVEYRLPVWWRFGLAGFAGAGQVAPSPGDFAFDRFHPAGGVGLRILLDESEGMNLRFDYGVGEDGASGVYITFAEAF